MNGQKLESEYRGRSQEGRIITKKSGLERTIAHGNTQEAGWGRIAGEVGNRLG